MNRFIDVLSPSIEFLRACNIHILRILQSKAILAVGTFLFLVPMLACSGASENDYMEQVRPLATQYNSARDVLDAKVRAADSVSTIDQAIDLAERGIPDLEQAIEEMNDAYETFSMLEVTEKYRSHQRLTLLAWSTGIRATKLFKSHLQDFLDGSDDDADVLLLNIMFREEDRYQSEARLALQAVR